MCSQRSVPLRSRRMSPAEFGATLLAAIVEVPGVAAGRVADKAEAVMEPPCTWARLSLASWVRSGGTSRPWVWRDWVL